MSFSRCISTPIYVYTYYCSTNAPTLGEVSIELIPLQFPYFPHTMPQLQGVDGWYEINWCMSLTNNIGQIGKKNWFGCASNCLAQFTSITKLILVALFCWPSAHAHMSTRISHTGIISVWMQDTYRTGMHVLYRWWSGDSGKPIGMWIHWS